MILKFKVISGAIWNTLSSGFSFFLSIATVAILAHLLKPGDFGLYAMVAVVINILDAFSDMGVSAAIISFRDVTHDELNSLFYFNLALGIGLTVFVIMTSPVVVYYYKEPGIYGYLWILALNFTVAAPATVFNVLMKKEMKFAMLSKINMAASLVYSVVTIVCAYFTRSVASFIVGILAQSCVTTGLNVYVGMKTWRPGKIRVRYQDLKRYLSFGLFQMGERMINKINWNIDYLLIGRFLGVELLGYYSLAYDLMMKPLQRINPIINSVAFPALADIQENRIQLKRYFLKMVRYLVYLMGPIYLLFFILSEPLIVVFYGDNWMLSVPVLAVFSLLGLLRSMGTPMGNLILAKGRADIGFWLNLFQTLFLFGANFMGLKWGIIGVALSTLIVTLSLFFPAGFLIRHYLVGMSVKEYIEEIKKPLLFIFGAAAIILLLQKYVISLYLLPALFIYSGIFGVIYLLFLGIFDRAEIEFLWKSLKEYGLAKKKVGKEGYEAG